LFANWSIYPRLAETALKGQEIKWIDDYLHGVYLWPAAVQLDFGLFIGSKIISFMAQTEAHEVTEKRCFRLVLKWDFGKGALSTHD
jgi:hypothetical protein